MKIAGKNFSRKYRQQSTLRVISQQKKKGELKESFVLSTNHTRKSDFDNSFDRPIGFYG